MMRDSLQNFGHPPTKRHASPNPTSFQEFRSALTGRASHRPLLRL